MTDHLTIVDRLADPMTAPVLLPMLAGVICLLTPVRAERLRDVIALLATALTVVLVWPLFAQGVDLRLEIYSWLPLRIDRLSALVALSVSVFGLLVAWYSVGYMKRHEHHRGYFTYLLWTIGAALATVIANDLVVFLVCWGFLALTLYLMVGGTGPGAAQAARKALMIVAGTDALLVLGVALVWSLSGTTRMDAGALPLNGPAAHVAFLTFVVAAFAKAGVVPFHSWVADCGEKADAPVAAFLLASLDKLLGIYLLVRVALELFEINALMQTMFLGVGAVTVVGAAMMAMVQRDLKRLLAYTTISQVGYMVLGLGTGTAIGIAGGLFHMLNHAIYKGCLFFGAGAVEKAVGTTDLNRLGGLAKLMPYTLVAFTIAAVATSGIPPLNGFASKWMVYQGILSTSESGAPGWIVWLGAAMLGSSLTLASLVKVLHAVFLCKPAPNVAEHPVRDVGLSMSIPMLVLAALCIVFGVFASAVPLEWLVFPVVPATVPGVWWSELATILIVSSVGLGGILYAVSMSAGKLRRVETYIGGERLDDVYVHGEQPGTSRHLEVTGVDFYRTIEQLPVLHRLFELARAGAFDLYEVLAKGVSYIVTLLSAAHNGALPVYLTWFLVGVVAVIYTIAQTGP